MTVRKTIAFNAPYIGKTFQDLADDVIGIDGYLEGGKTTEAGGLGQVAPYKYIQRGIVVENDAATPSLVLPTAAEPWFVIAANPDDDLSTPVSLRISSDLNEVVSGAVVIAYKTNGSWKNPVPLTALGQQAPRADSALLDGFSGFGTIASNLVTAVQVNKGEIVDPGGARRTVGTDTVAAVAQSFTPIGTFKDLHRTDYALLRQREGVTGQIVHALGDVQGHSQTAPAPATVVTSATAKSPMGMSQRGVIASSWFSYGDGTALKLYNLGTTTLSTLLTASGNVTYVVLAGYRTSDNAGICVYTDGNAVRIVAFNSTTGAKIGSETTIDTQANACIRLSAVIDSANVLHVVYQHDEGGAPPNQQIYYAKVSVVIATFGLAVAGTPRLANGVNSTRNDTYPTIAVDRRRRAHIAYATGTTSDEFGELRYILIDENGATVSKTSYNTYGYQPDPHSKKGIQTRAHNSVQRPKIAVTPHDEVYVLAHAIETASSDAFLIIFSPDFTTRLGFAMVQLREFVPYANSAGKVLASFDLMADELGQLQVMSTWGSGLNILHGRLQTPFAPNGILGESYNEVAETTLINEAATYVDIAPGPAGGLLCSFIVGTSIKVGLFQSRRSGKRFRPHPKDIVLASWLIEGQGSATADIDEKTFNVFSTRPKRLNYPFLVGGDEGDFTGFDGLHDACAEANLRGGATVVVRSGEYKSYRTVRINAGVSVRADGLAILEFGAAATTQPWISINESGASYTVSGISGQVVTLGYLTPQAGRILPGDIIQMATSGIHRILRVIESAAASIRLVVDGAAPVGAAALVYATGIRLENLVIRAASNGAAVMQGVYCVGVTLKNITFFGQQADQALACVGFRESVLENIDVSGTTVTGGGVGIQMAKGRGNTLRSCRFGSATSGGGQFKTLASSDEDLNLVLSHCTGPEDASAVYLVSATRTTPLYFHGSRGLVSGDLANCTRELRDTGDTIRGDLVPDTTNSRKLGSAAIAFAEFYARAIKPDLDSTGTVGSALKRFADARFVAMTAQQVNADQTSQPTLPALTITADPTSLTPLVRVTGMSGGASNQNASIMDAMGNWIYTGNHFIDDFNYDDEPSGVWYDNSLGGTVAVPETNFRSIVGLHTGTLNLNSATYNTSGNSAGWKAAETPFFRARINLGATRTNAKHTIGLHGLLEFVRDTNHGTNATSWHIYANISSGASVDQGVDLSAIPVLDDWYFMWLAVLSTTQFFWGIGTIPDQPDEYGIVTLASAETFRTTNVGVLYASVLTRNTTDKLMLVDYMEGHGVLRQVLAD